MRTRSPREETELHVHIRRRRHRRSVKPARRDEDDEDTAADVEVGTRKMITARAIDAIAMHWPSRRNSSVRRRARRS